MTLPEDQVRILTEPSTPRMYRASKWQVYENGVGEEPRLQGANGQPAAQRRRATSVLARRSAGLVDSAIRGDAQHLELLRRWLERPMWEMEPRDADGYIGTVLSSVSTSTRAARVLHPTA